MKLPKLIFIVFFSLTCLGCKSQTSVSRVEIVEPTIEQEATSIWRTINDITFFEKQGYKINLPKDSLIDSLITKSKNGTFGNEDFNTIYTLVETKIFDKKNYEPAIQKVTNQTELISSLVYEIDTSKHQWHWNFNMFDKYRIIFTLFGTGGSYDPDEGTITLLTNMKGDFMNYKNPVNTIIHEITHMGMEYSIVRKYNLTHGLKERIVDTFIHIMFKEQLPEYKIQNMGDTKIDKYFNQKKDIDSLNTTLSKFLNK
ncbi:hypothetical protein [Aquimarina aggregata]|uniref:hypothetical protein n=1 Tax=Aquimarina aggregata TaxID=1642818 RepID=UPI0024923FAF|nr:hypothetical protein [Aquimarina aggregata]